MHEELNTVCGIPITDIKKIKLILDKYDVQDMHTFLSCFDFKKLKKIQIDKLKEVIKADEKKLAKLEEEV